VSNCDNLPLAKKNGNADRLSAAREEEEEEKEAEWLERM
jgi:hypothetical protein